MPLNSASTSFTGSSKVIELVQRVEHVALQLHGRHLAELLAHALLDRVLELGQVLEAHLLGEVFVDGGLLRRFHLGHLDREGSRLAGQLGHAIGLGEGHPHSALVAGLGADELLLETGDELVRSELQRHVIRRAALERRVVDGAHEADGQLVAICGLAVLFLEVLGLGGEAVQRLVRSGPRSPRRRAGQRKARMVLHLEIGNDLEATARRRGRPCRP